MNPIAENAFFIETPLQLLNAVEANRHFKLQNSHLLLHVGGTGFAEERFQAILTQDEWARVRYVRLLGNTFLCDPPGLPEAVSRRLAGFCYDRQQWRNRRIIDALAGEYRGVRRLFLGNYLQGHVEYMRHFANVVRPETLYLLDDGTDALMINEARHGLASGDGRGAGGEAGSPLRRIKAGLRRRLLDWDVTEAESVTFFSAYDLVPAARDRFVKNGFETLRKLSAQVAPGEEVLFLGQCLVDDGSLPPEAYLGYLAKVKAHFAGERLVYVPHPRESARMVEAVRDGLGLEIRRLTVPVEVEVSVAGRKPKVLASFFCSAMVNCHVILQSQIKLRAFYIPPDALSRYRELSRVVYDYFDERSDEIELVRLG